MGGGDGTMSFMVCTSNETGKSLAGVLADGSGMLGQVMGGHTSGSDRRNSRTHGHAAAGPEAIRAPSLGQSDATRAIRQQNKSQKPGKGLGHSLFLACSRLVPR